MQATLDIDDDVFRTIETMSRKESKSTGQLLSELARRALGQPTGKVAAQTVPAEAFCGITPFPHRGGVVTDALINQLREGDCY